MPLIEHGIVSAGPEKDLTAQWAYVVTLKVIMRLTSLRVYRVP
jgi:hypothetical protein